MFSFLTSFSSKLFPAPPSNQAPLRRPAKVRAIVFRAASTTSGFNAEAGRGIEPIEYMTPSLAARYPPPLLLQTLSGKSTTISSPSGANGFQLRFSCTCAGPSISRKQPLGAELVVVVEAA